MGFHSLRRLYEEGECILSKQFNIRCPLGVHNQHIYYNDEKDDRVELLDKLMLNYWREYCNTHWVWLGKFEPNKRNYEDKVKSFLSRCGDFLLHDRYDKTNIVTPYTNKKIKINEYSLDGDWENEEKEITPEETTCYLNRFINEEFQDGKIFEKSNGNIIKPKKNTQTKISRIINVYSEEEKETEDYERVHISNTFNIWKKATKKIPARKGMIDKTKPYISEWCAVDTENIFTFQDKKHKISEDVSQYTIRTKKPRYDDYKPDYQMDQILVYEQEGELFFFDQDIQQLEDNKITVIT